MASPAEWVATSLEKHHSVSRALVVGDDRVEIHRDRGLRTVIVRVVNTRVEAPDLDRIGVGDVDAIVTIRKGNPYSWDAKVEAFNRGRDLYSNRELWSALGHERFIRSETPDIRYFVDRMQAHNKVDRLERVGQRLFRIHRRDALDPLLVYCADEYMLSEEFVDRVLQEYPDTQAIANLSSWNKITPEAHAEGSRRGCPVFDLSGIYNALNHKTDAIRDL